MNEHHAHNIQPLHPEALLQCSRKITELLQSENEMIMSHIKAVINQSFEDLRELAQLPCPQVYEQKLAGIRQELGITFTQLKEESDRVRQAAAALITQFGQLSAGTELEATLSAAVVRSYTNAIRSQQQLRIIAEVMSLLAVNRLFHAAAGC